jgi:hypothetical protein
MASSFELLVASGALPTRFGGTAEPASLDQQQHTEKARNSPGTAFIIFTSPPELA